jgi:hypothetical protein
VVRRAIVTLLAAALAAGAAAAPASAADPGRWQLVRVSTIPLTYYQGVTNDPARQLFFSGHLGIFRTDPALRETGRNPDVIPPPVKAAEGYDHIGDLDYDAAEGGRLLLPLECYYPGTPNGGNTCPQTGSVGTGSIGVADAATLAWRYHVKLDQAEIKKAMWAEVSPDGAWLWTQDGNDLLRYSMADITPANATTVGPGGASGPAIRPVQRLAGAVPPSGITGATFHEGRLYVAGQGADPSGEIFQVWSIDVADGSRRLEVERRIVGESEGLTTVGVLGGLLQWQVMPYNQSGPPTYGIDAGALLTFAPRSGTAGGTSGSAARRPRPGSAWVRPHRQRLATALRRGVDVAMGCHLPCRMRLRVVEPRGRRTVAAREVVLRRGGTRRLHLRVRRALRAQVRRSALRGKLVLRATVADEQGRRTLRPRGVRLR